MGYHIHHTIVVTCFDDAHILKAHGVARNLFGNLVSDISNAGLNGFRSFFVAPDGSKEGWPESGTFDDLRHEFKGWLREQNLFVDWAEIAFGGDEPKRNTDVVVFGQYEERE